MSNAMSPPPTHLPKPKLLLAIDLGTTKVDASMRIKETDVALSMEDVFAVKLGIKNAVPHIVGFDHHENFVWGDEVAAALAGNTMSPEKVIEVSKLSLYKAHATSEIAQRVMDQLKQMKTSMEEVLSLIFKSVVQKALDQLQSLDGMWRCLDGVDLNDLQVELFLSVPDMWKAPANRYMTVAAKMAEVASVQLVPESLCAAAYFMHDMQKSKRTPLNPGDQIQVVDAGGGTTDITCYEMPAQTDAGAATKLQRSGLAVGGLCGSHFINERFLKWLKVETDKGPVGFDTTVRRMGYDGTPYAGFHRAANEAFDRIKPDFTPALAASHLPIYVLIMGNQHSALAITPVWQVVIPCAQMKLFFDEVINDNFRLVDPLITPSVKRMIIPGGLGNSQYFRDELQARLLPRHPHLKINEGDVLLLTGQQAVSAGALLRYNEIDLNAAPRTGYFGVLTHEPFDESRHPDGIIKAGTLLPTKPGARHRWARKDTLIPTIVCSSVWTDGDEALARWAPISRTTNNDNGSSANVDHVTGAWQTRFIDRGDDTDLVFQIYWTDDASIVAGSAVFENGPEDGTLKFEVEKWGPAIFVKCPDFEALGFDLKITKGVAPRFGYQLTYLVEVRERGPNASVRVRLVLPNGRQPLDLLGKPIYQPGALPGDINLIDIVDENMDGAGCTPFTRN
ncbi:unnamed protein product [Zymoseptoria tritici ST99CH_3D1]|nr:unnamed protein product [Zymoseptoria tritici ST99CH_3D1]